ncbi:MFS transporter [Streptomyces sp. NPDC006879]|uniref:MFS transporter n=1 Tax=Streptomyces sp. NPDC006879 TaxID=3364767 RepID=UPI0036C7CD97
MTVASGGLSRVLLLLFATASGVAVGSLYFLHPLLGVIASELDAPQALIGLLVTATQVGYALGVFFIVPLGDYRDRRRLVPLMMMLSALALLACALAPGVKALAVATAAVGATAVAGQILTPLAGDLSEDAHRGKAVGIVVSGLITGILAARVFSGVLADLAGWRAVFLAGAAVEVLLGLLLYRSIPRLAPCAGGEPYGSLLRSVLRLVVRERGLQVSMVLGGLGFVVFTMFWTALTFLLSGPPYEYPTSVIGLFGLAGLVGALGTQGAGRLHDRGRSVTAVGLSWLVVSLSWVAAGFGGHVLLVVLAAVVTLDVGVQAQHILNQSRIFEIDPAARSRLNTAYISGNFVAGAVGSLVGTWVWSRYGWTGVCIAGEVLSVIALGVWFLARNDALRPPLDQHRALHSRG